ncbi:hypothetical protein [Chitinophaga defluvii]|uniref:Uncharacterized protein n=1 Tax=Chitinophaga defluvii TaxID=3163343 RepID=A0ABV2T377_9BACT
MKHYEDPINFDIKQQCGNDLLSFDNLLEIGQGGPVVGDLFINGKQIAGYRFGGPFICDEDYIYIPAYNNRLFNLGFKLAMIDRASLNVKLVGPSLSLIFLEKIQNNRVFYFEDIFKNKSNNFQL